MLVYIIDSGVKWAKGSSPFEVAHNYAPTRHACDVSLTSSEAGNNIRTVTSFEERLVPPGRPIMDIFI